MIKGTYVLDYVLVKNYNSFVKPSKLCAEAKHTDQNL